MDGRRESPPSVEPSAAGEPVARDRVLPRGCRWPALASASLEPMTKEAFLFRLRLMGTTMPAVFAASVLFGATLGADFFWYNAYASIGTAALIGLPIFTFEALFVNSTHGRSAVGGRRYVVDYPVFLHRLTFGRLGPDPEPPDRTRRIPQPATWALSLAQGRAASPPVHRPGRLHHHRRAHRSHAVSRADEPVRLRH